MDKKPVFSIITICYRRLEYLQEALGAMLRQTYPHIEIIIVSNGSIEEVYNYITDLERKEPRIKIVHFKENQYRNDGSGHMNKVCINAGLNAATGDYVWYQSDDDVIANDFVEKMVALFEGNPACTSAAGFVKDIDAYGKLIPQATRETNYRPKYMPGYLLALSTLNNALPSTKTIMFSAPGSVFAFRRQELVKLGGYHPNVEWGHLYGVVPFGVTGFDETAILYWRRHEGQLNQLMTSNGDAGQKITMNLISEWQLQARWEVFGKDVAQYVVRKLYDFIYEDATGWFVINLYYLRPQASWIIFKDMWNKPYFWRRLPILLWKRKVYIKFFLKPKFRKFFETYPGLVKRMPFLLPLQKQAFK